MMPLVNDCMAFDSDVSYQEREKLCEFVNTSMNDIYQNYVRVYGKMDEDKWIEFQQLLSEAVS